VNAAKAPKVKPAKMKPATGQAPKFEPMPSPIDALLARADAILRVGSPASDAGKKEGPAKNGAAKDNAAKDGPAKDGPAKDGPAKDGPAKDGPGYEAEAEASRPTAGSPWPTR
jgi:23S rRNA pseudouridine2605 synthase